MGPFTAFVERCRMQITLCVSIYPENQNKRILVGLQSPCHATSKDLLYVLVLLVALLLCSGGNTLEKLHRSQLNNNVLQF